MHNKRWRVGAGFTIVELLIVIVVIAILAAITIVSYNGIQQRANESKIKSDLSMINKAILSARTTTGKTLTDITGASPSYVTADGCGGKADGTDLAAFPQSDICWVRYNAALQAISTASGANIRNLKDPWGRPYYIYEQEGRTSPTSCTQDQISSFSRPFVQWNPNWTYAINISNSLSGC